MSDLSDMTLVTVQSSHMTVTLGWGSGGRPFSTYSMMAIFASSPFLFGILNTRVYPPGRSL